MNLAVGLAAKYLRENGRPEASRAIVALTLNSGKSTIPDRAILGALWQANVTFSGLFANGAAKGSIDLRFFVQATGGQMLEMDVDHVPLAEVFESLRERYLLSFQGPKGEPNFLRSLRIELTPEVRARHPQLEIRARGGYVTN
jgi:hypothetical protein